MPRRSVDTEAILGLVDELRAFERDANKSELPDIGEEVVKPSEAIARLRKSQSARAQFAREKGTAGVLDLLKQVNNNG